MTCTVSQGGRPHDLVRSGGGICGGVGGFIRPGSAADVGVRGYRQARFGSKLM